MSKPFIDAIKEFFRIVLLAVIPVAIAQLQNGGIDFKALGIIVAIAVLKAIDELLHEQGKLKEDKNLTLGLTRF